MKFNVKLTAHDACFAAAFVNSFVTRYCRYAGFRFTRLLDI